MAGMPERVTLWTTGGGFCMRPYGPPGGGEGISTQ